MSLSAASHFARARRLTICRGTSPLVTLSSIVAGRSASGVMPTCSNRASLRGDADASTSFGLNALGCARVVRAARDGGGRGFALGASPLACSVLAGNARFSPSLLLKPVSDPTFSEIIGGHLDQNLIARKHSDAIFAHSSRRVGDDLVFVLELHPESGVREQLGDHPRKFEHFFFRH